MNRIFRTLWNDVSRSYVAVAETVCGRGKSASGICTDGATTPASRPGPTLARHRPLPLALEQRFMFDGAAVAPVADAAAAAAAEAHAAIAAVPAPVEVRAADPVKDGGKKEVVFVDTSVKDYKTLEAGIRDGVAIVEIDGAKDGLAQIAKWAESHSGYDSISILGHGSQATLNLGTTALTSASLASSTVQAELAEIGQSLTADGDLMLYGCDVAKGTDGEAFVAALASATGADVAASNDATGAASKGGDWVLEKQSGQIDSRLAVDTYALADANVLLDLPNGLQNVTDTTLPGSFISGFTLTVDTSNAQISPSGADLGLYFSDLANPTGPVQITVAADGGTLSSFDLAAVAMPYYLEAGELGDVTVKFVGYKLGGSTVETTGTANLSAGFTGADFSAFTGITKFTFTLSAVSDTSYVTFDSFSIANAKLNAAPIVSNLSGNSVTYTEGGSAVKLDAASNATVTDSDSANFDGGKVTVSIATGRVSTEDQLSIVNQGAGAGQIGVSGSDVTYGGATIGSFTGGSGTNDLVVTLNASATPTAVQALLRDIAYSNSNSADPATASRTVRFTVADGDGGTSEMQDVTVAVIGVNDAPVFTKGANQSVTEDAGAQTVPGWATGISKGASGESAQTINFVVSNDNASLFSAQPTIDANGTLTYTAAANASGTATVTVFLHDDGGTSNGGVDSSATQTFTISVSAANDAPVLDAAQSPTFTVLAGSGVPVGAVGALVSSLTTGVSDVNAGALKGVAIAAADTTNGTWYFSTDGGANWSAIGAVSNSSALLLAADARVYFKPASGWSGDENLSFRAWDQTSGSAGSKADASSNGGATAFSTATDTAACHVPGLPAITSAAYDAATGVLTVTGTDLVALAGTNNDIVANRLTLTGEGGATYTLSDTANVDIASATSFTLTLSATDKAAINRMVNKNGTTSTSGTTFNLAAAEDWAAGADAAAAIVDLTGNGVTVSNVAVPTISSASYDAASGTLVVTGSGFSSLSGATNDIVANKLTLSGEGGTTYTLTDTADVDIASGTAFSLTLSAADRAAVNRIINRNGASSTGATAFNLAAGEDWAAGAAAAVVVADLTGNPVTASHVAVPAITGATYDATSGMLIVTGSGFTDRSGAGNDIIANKLTLTGEGGATYTLTNTANAEITSGTSFILMLSATDRAAVSQILNKNGAASTGGTAFNLAAAEDWAAGADDVVVVADLTGNAIAVANVAVPTITSATYDSGSGTLVVTGTGLTARAGANNDIVANKLTLTGEGGATYTLTDTANVDIASATGFVLNLSAADQVAVAQLINKTGTASTGGTTYNLSAAEDWAAGADAAMAIADLSGNAITAGILPRITGVSSSTADGAYKAGDVISIAVNFNQNVAVTGTPSLLLETGTIDRVVNYTSGSGTSVLTFSYTVQAGDTAADLDYLGASALALNGGSIVASAGGTSAILTLAAPGTANSLGAAKAIVIDTSAPTNTVTTAHFSADSGTSSTDFVTRTAAQTISGTLGSALASGEHVEVSLDNGANWTNATASGSTWSLAGQTLVASNTLKVRVSDAAGNCGTAISQAYVLDTSAPVITFSALAFSADRGTSPSDFVTNAAAQTINATLSSAPSGGDVVYGSLDNGASWTDITGKVSGTTLSWDGVTLSASNTLKLKVSDASGNDGAVASQAYTLDRAAPTATIVLDKPSLAAGETATVTITFSEAVGGFSDANLTVANGSLSGLTSSDNVTWTATFTPAADLTDASNVITLNQSSVQDGAGNSGSGSATSANYAVLTARTLSYSATTFAEAAANDGSVTSTLTITLANATFSGADGEALGTVSNVPAGLTAHLVRVDATHATLSLSGKASAHANAQDLSHLTVSFADGDFASSPAASIAGATTTLAIDFADPAAAPVVTPVTPVTPATPATPAPAVEAVVAPPVVVPPPVVVLPPAAVTPPASLTPATPQATPTPEPVGETVHFIAPVSPLTLAASPVAESSLASLAAPQLVAATPATPAPALAPTEPARAPASAAAAAQADAARAPATAGVAESGTPLLTQGGGFQVVVSSTGAATGDSLVVNRGIADQAVASGTASRFAIPADAFAAGSAGAVVTLSARQSDGRPLPAWVRFDAASGKFDGQPPPGYAGEVSIRVTARDAQGHEAVVTFKVKVGEKSNRDGQRAQPERPGRASLSDQLRLAARPHPALERLARITALRDAA